MGVKILVVEVNWEIKLLFRLDEMTMEYGWGKVCQMLNFSF